MKTHACIATLRFGLCERNHSECGGQECATPANKRRWVERSGGKPALLGESVSMPQFVGDDSAAAPRVL